MKMKNSSLAEQLFGKMTPARLAVDLLLLACLLAIGWVMADALWMPGRSFAGSQPPLSATELQTESELRSSLKVLTQDIGARNSETSLARTVAFLQERMKELGLEVNLQEYAVERVKYSNVIGELRGTNPAARTFIVCAHYDSLYGTVGANDNGTGVASVLELARLMHSRKPKDTVRFVLFGTEEPPYFSSKEMGSYFYANQCKERKEDIAGVFVMETLGYYTDAPNSQRYPSHFVPFYPTQGNFITFVGNRNSRKLVEACMNTFRSSTPFPSEGVAAPEWVNGVDWADQYWFWKFGYPAVMVTDTAVYRYPHYHTKQDTADKICYPQLARVVGGVYNILVAMTAKQ